MVSSILSEQKPAMLSESHRSRLADIVGRMESDGVATESIQEYVNAYKRKYTQNPNAKPVDPQDGGLGGGLGTLPTGLSDRQAAFETAKQNAGAKAGTYFKDEAAKRKAKTLNADQTAKVLNDAAASVAGAFTDNPVMDALAKGKKLMAQTLGQGPANLAFGPGEKGLAGHVAGAVGGVASAPFDIGADVVNFASKGEWQAGLNILLKSGALIVPAGKLASVGLKALNKTKAGIEFNAVRGMKALLESGIDPDKARAIVARIESGMPEAPPVAKGAEVVPTVARTPMSTRREPASVPPASHAKRYDLGRNLDQTAPYLEQVHEKTARKHTKHLIENVGSTVEENKSPKIRNGTEDGAIPQSGDGGLLPKDTQTGLGDSGRDTNRGLSSNLEKPEQTSNNPTPLKTVVLTDPKTGKQQPAHPHEFSDSDLLEILDRKRQSAQTMASEQSFNANGKTLMQDVKALQAEAERRGLRGAGESGKTGGVKPPKIKTVKVSGGTEIELPVNADGTITVYHRTHAPVEDIHAKGFAMGKENTGEVFVSSHADGAAKDYGPTLVEIRIKPNRLRLDDEFSDGEYHFAISPQDATAGIVKPLDSRSPSTVVGSSDTGAAPKVPETGAQPPLGSTVEGTFGTSNQAFEASQNIEAPVGKGQSAKSLVDDAAKSMDHEQALDLSRKIADKSEPYNPTNAAKVQAGVAKLESKVNDYAKLMDDAEASGDGAAYQRYQESYQQAKANLQEFADNVQKGKSEWSDVGRILATQVDEMGNFAAMQESLRRSKPKGVAVTEKESQLVKALAEDYNAKTKELEAAQAEIARLRAESTVQTVKRGPRFSKESLDAELDELLKEFNTAKSKLSAGLDPELLAIVGKIALNYGKRGINKLDEIVAAVQKHIPGIERQDVIDALAQKQETRTQSELAKRLAELRAEARKLSTETTTKKAEVAAKREAQKAETARLNQVKRDRIEAERLEREGRKEEAKKLRDDMKARASEAAKADKEALNLDAQAAKDQNRPFDRETELRRQIAEYERKIAEGDYFVETKDLRVKTKKALELQDKLDALRRSFMHQRKFANTGPLGKTLHIVDRVGSTLREGVATGDVSFPGIQGAAALLTDTQAWGKGAKAAFKSYGRLGYDETVNLIKNDPAYSKVMSTGVDLPGISGEHEEVFGGSYLENVKGVNQLVKASARSYDGSATITRFMMAKSHIQLAEALNGGKPLSPESLKVIGDAVNTLTGRATSSLGKAVKGLDFGRGFFAPSWYVSTFEAATLKPLWHAIDAGAKTGEWATAKLYARKLGRMYVAAAGTLAATKLALENFTDWQVQLSPNSTNFGKAYKIQNGEVVAVDLLPAQISNAVKFFSTIGLGKMDLSGKVDTSVYGRTQAFGQLIEGKMAPAPKMVLNMLAGLHGEESFGKSFDPRTGEGWKNVGLGSLPISAQSAKEVVETKSMEPWEKLLLVPFMVFSRAPNSYDLSKSMKGKVPDSRLGQGGFYIKR